MQDTRTLSADLLIPITEFRPFHAAMEVFQEFNRLFDTLPEHAERDNPACYAAMQKANYDAYTVLEATIDAHVSLTAARALGLNATLYANLYGRLIEGGTPPEEEKAEAEEVVPPTPAEDIYHIGNDRPFRDALQALYRTIAEAQLESGLAEYVDHLQYEPGVCAAEKKLNAAVHAFARRSYATCAPTEGAG